MRRWKNAASISLAAKGLRGEVWLSVGSLRPWSFFRMRTIGLSGERESCWWAFQISNPIFCPTTRLTTFKGEGEEKSALWIYIHRREEEVEEWKIPVVPSSSDWNGLVQSRIERVSLRRNENSWGRIFCGVGTMDERSLSGQPSGKKEEEDVSSLW